MGFYTWKKNFNTGIYIIDQQHQEFMKLVNDCHEASTGIHHATIGHDLANKLKMYILNHFNFEESMLSNTGYSSFNQHKLQHDLFASRITELMQSQQSRNLNGIALFLPLIQDWFLNHIIDYDLKYVPYLLDKHIDQEAAGHTSQLADSI